MITIDTAVLGSQRIQGLLKSLSSNFVLNFFFAFAFEEEIIK